MKEKYVPWKVFHRGVFIGNVLASSKWEAIEKAMSLTDFMLDRKYFQARVVLV
jgi:hypothetical protein